VVCSVLGLGSWFILHSAAPTQKEIMTREPNKTDAANPAIASLLHAGPQWRGVADPRRWLLRRAS
jgi:hypothetical protein